MAVDRIADVAVVAAQGRDHVANMRRRHELPVQVRRVAPDGEVELRRQRVPELGEAVVEALNEPDFGAERPRPRDDLDDRQRDRGDEAVDADGPGRNAEARAGSAA